MIRAALLALSIATPAVAQDGCPPAAGPAERVMKVAGDGALVMEDRREIMPAGIAPRAGADFVGVFTLAVEGKGVQLSALSERPDRWGRHEAHLYDASGRLVAETLVQQGHAIRTPGLEPEACRRHLDALEPKAFPTLRITEDALGTAVRLSGRVTAQRRGSGRIYLDLASHETGRITVSWRDRGKDDWTGKRLRLRGWLDWSNGLLVMVAAPFDVEVEADR